MSVVEWTAEECAAHCGVSVGTWNHYVYRARRHGKGGCPQPLYHRPADGKLVWDAAAVTRWHAERPGRGNYTTRAKKP